MSWNIHPIKLLNRLGTPFWKNCTLIHLLNLTSLITFKKVFEENHFFQIFSFLGIFRYRNQPGHHSADLAHSQNEPKWPQCLVKVSRNCAPGWFQWRKMPINEKIWEKTFFFKNIFKKCLFAPCNGPWTARNLLQSHGEGSGNLKFRFWVWNPWAPPHGEGSLVQRWLTVPHRNFKVI